MKNWIIAIVVSLAFTLACDQKAAPPTVPDEDAKTKASQDGSQSAEPSAVSEITDTQGNPALSGGGVVEEEHLGVPFYPNSRDMMGSRPVDPASGGNVMSIRETSDSVEKVNQFYISKLGEPTDTFAVGDSYYHTWVKGKRTTKITVSGSNGSTNITIFVSGS